MTGFDAALDDADLHALVDGRMDAGRGASLAAALAADPEMRARIDGWRRQNDHLRSLFASVLVEPVPVRLIPTGPALRPRPPASGAEVGRPTPRTVGAIATVVVGVGLIGFALGAFVARRPLAPDPLELRGETSAGGTLAGRAAEAHRTYLSDGIRPVELTGTEEPRLLHWIQRRLGSPFHIPDLRGLGWTLAGGRVIPGADGPAAFLVYASGGDRLALTVGRAGASEERDAPRGGDDPVQVVAWRDRGLDAVLSTTRGTEWLSRDGAVLRDSIRAQLREGAASP